LWHLVDFRRVVLLDVTQNPDVLIGHEVDGDTFSVEPARSADTMDVEFS